VTRREAISFGEARLRAAGIESPRLEARLLLAQATGTTPEMLLGEPDCVAETSGYEKLLLRREAHEPLALILGHREFWSMEFAVSDATLVPRPASEALIEAARAAFPDGAHPPRRIVDLGTGTGCLLLAALAEFPTAFGIGLDVSPAAVSLARRNAGMLGFGGRTAFVVADWARGVAGRFDLVIANPPYVATAEIPSLMPEVALFEPRGALDGGIDGLDAYRVLVPALPALLAAAGVAVFEIGSGQAAAVATLAAGVNLTTSLSPDLAGTPRAIVLRNALP
jgi:release factor glutamine methyltransferase